MNNERLVVSFFCKTKPCTVLYCPRYMNFFFGDLINILSKDAYDLCHYLYSIAFHRSLTTGVKHNKVTAYFVLNLVIQNLNKISFNVIILNNI